MEVKNKIMYHFHNKDIYSDIWQVGNTFTVDNNFNSNFSQVVKYFSPTVKVKTKDGLDRQSFDYILEDYLNKEKYKMRNDDVTRQMFNDAIKIIRDVNLCRREYLLEKYRREYCPSLPSRYHSIWLTDFEHLEFWKKKLYRNDFLQLFKVKVTGELFKSSDIFIPDDKLTMEEMYEQSEKYWHPDFKESTDRDIEYLFQGKVEILEMIEIK